MLSGPHLVELGHGANKLERELAAALRSAVAEVEADAGELGAAVVRHCSGHDERRVSR
ncbi:hypothetical protein [Sorangium sp. So ce204]|uniref:hypothetical protein n=1 Tax=Sorangium sp. So ce204 TaxID=3133288 RepID=UPI003F607C51